MVASRDPVTRIVGWVAVIFFGLGGQYTTAWADVAGFSAMRPISIYPVQKVVVINFAKGYTRMVGLHKLGRSIGGYEGGLPDTYGLKADDLAVLMNEWRARYGQPAPQLIQAACKHRLP